MYCTTGKHLRRTWNQWTTKVKVSYRSVSSVGIEKILRLTACDNFYGDELNKNNRTMMLRPEQKSVSLIKTLLNKYTQPVDLFFDQLAEPC